MKHRLLIVDDELTIVLSLQAVFEDLGYDVTISCDPVATSALLEGEEFDCFLTDILMPGLSGLELVKSVHERWPDVAIVVMTGAPDLATAVEAMRTGASDYVIKPVFENRIEQVVAKAIERASLKRQVRLQTAELQLLLDASRSLGDAVTSEDVDLRCAEFDGRLAVRANCSLARATLENISRQAKARISSQLFEEQARLGALMEAQPAGVVYLDDRGVTIVANELARQLLSIRPAEQVLPAELYSRLAEIDALRPSLEIRKPGDPNRILHIRSGPVTCKERRMGTVLTVVDVTEDRERDLKLFQSARLATLGDMLAGVFHELNNPLCIIQGFAEELAESLDAANGELARKILRAGNRCLELLAKVSPFVVGDGQAQRPLSVQDQTREVLDLVQGKVRAKGVRMKPSLEPTPLVMGNAGELQQLVMALVSNALDVLPTYGEIQVRTGAAADGSTVLEVEDNGCGMCAETLARIFDPFFTTKDPGKGTGLGLTLAHWICTRMGGTISVESWPQVGTKFLVTLPATELASAAPPR